MINNNNIDTEKYTYKLQYINGKQVWFIYKFCVRKKISFVQIILLFKNNILNIFLLLKYEIKIGDLN